MSILPYGTNSLSGWTGAYGLSLALHGALAAVVLGGAGGWLAAPPDAPENAPFLISFAPLQSDPVQPAPLAPDPKIAEIPVATTPETLAPARPDAETLSPVTPDSLTAETVIANTETDDPRPLLPSGGGGATPVPTATPAVRPEQDLALAAWIDRIRATEAPTCLIALPNRAGETGVDLTLVGPDQATLSAYANRLLAESADRPGVTQVLIDPRQCPALEFLRSHSDYPARHLGLSVDAPVVTSGGRLTGYVRGSAGRQLTLLLVDDNGVVQSLNRFLAFSGDLARFEIPVTRDGETRATGQIVIALATKGQPAQLLDRAGRLASEVFAGLPRSLSDESLLALVTVEIR